MWCGSWIDMDGGCGVVRGWGRWGMWCGSWMGVDGECGVVRGWGRWGMWCGSWMGVDGEWRIDVLVEFKMEETSN